MKRNHNLENVKIMRKYEVDLRDGEGYSERTVRVKMDDVARFDEFLNGEDFRILDEDLAVKYKMHAKSCERNGIPIQLRTINGRLLSVRDFYNWLRLEPGYKSRVKERAIKYFRLSRGEMKSIATQVNLRKTPKLEQVLTQIDSISGNTEKDMRDRALFAIMITTGIRVESLIMLRLKDFDQERLIITLNPLDGVATKFNKAMNPVVVPLDDRLLIEIHNWVKYLVDVKGFTPESPFFPMTHVRNMPDASCFVAKDVKEDFWKNTGAINKIFKDRSAAADLPYFHPHSYRRALFQIFIRFNPTEEEKLALSQNLGHDSIETTYRYYGQIDVNKRSELLSKENLQDIINRSSDRKGDSFEKKTENNMQKILKDLSEIKKNQRKNRER